MAATHGEHDPLVVSITSQVAEDFALAGGDESPTRRGTEEVGVDHNVTSSVNYVRDGTAHTVADADIPVGDRIDKFINALVARSYTNSERTAATKRDGIDDTSFCQKKDSVATDRAVANAVGPHFAVSLMHAFTNQPHGLSSRTVVRAKTIQNGVFESSGPRAADNINATAEVTFASEDGFNQMFVTRSRSA